MAGTSICSFRAYTKSHDNSNVNPLLRRKFNGNSKQLRKSVYSLKNDRKPLQAKNKKASNLPCDNRKSPFASKTFTKGCKPAPRKKKGEQKNLDWFDSDAVFGFGPEDE